MSARRGEFQCVWSYTPKYLAAVRPPAQQKEAESVTHAPCSSSAESFMVSSIFGAITPTRSDRTLRRERPLPVPCAL
jgi:hypothetical protein